MDFERPASRTSFWLVRAAILLLITAIAVAANLGVSRYFPNIPTVDSRMLIFDTVQRGVFIHQIRGVGRLVSEDITQRSATTKAVVEDIVALPGVAVDDDTLLLRLRNSELDRALADARSKRSEAEAELVTQQARLDSELLQLESTWQKLASDHALADAKYNVSLELRKTNATSRQQLEYERIAAASLLKQRDLAKKAYDRFRDSIPDHLAIYTERILQAETEISRQTEDKHSLQVRAGVHGVLAQVPVTVGQQVQEGELLAKIVNPNRLKAELRVAEVEARHLRVEQHAEVDTHHGIIKGTVVRIDPQVVDGSVTIDVSFDGQELPEQVRPDLSVTGLIEVNRLDDALSIDRPASAMAVSRGSIFRCLVSNHAVRTPVEYGLASANRIVIREGLQAGDRVVLSDIPEFEDVTELILD